MARAVPLVLGSGLVVALVFSTPPVVLGVQWDVINYLAAGQRLNAGHTLYALSPGDLPVPVDPGRYSVPLLSPPLVAVLWRPLAIVGPIAAASWWVLMAGSLVGSIVAFARRRLALTGVFVVALTLPLAYEFLEGNVNSFLIAACLGVWLLLGRGRDAWAGSLVALITGLKLLPIVVAWWLVTQARWTALRAFLIASAGLAIIVLVGAGPSAILDFLALRPGPTLLSLAGIGEHVLGLAPGPALMLPYLFLAAGLVAMLLARARPGLTFSLAIVLMVWGTPAVNTHTLGLLLAALVPLCFPWESTAA
jgi:hypothetical protein